MSAESNRSDDAGTEYSFVDDGESQQYQLWIGQELASLEQYVLEGDLIDFVHTETRPGFTHRGLASTLVKDALDDVRARNLKVRPYCQFVSEYIAEHPDYLNIVDHPEQFGLPPT